MVSLKPTKCCFCFSLKIGTAIISVISMIISVVWLIFAALKLHIYVKESGISADAGRGTAQLVFTAIFLISDIMLLAGACKEKPKLIFPWIVVSSSAVLLDAIGVILKFAVYLLSPNTADDLLLHILIIILAMCILTYFTVVAYAYYTELNAAQLHNRTEGVTFNGALIPQQPKIDDCDVMNVLQTKI